MQCKWKTELYTMHDIRYCDPYVVGDSARENGILGYDKDWSKASSLANGYLLNTVEPLNRGHSVPSV